MGDSSSTGDPAASLMGSRRDACTPSIVGGTEGDAPASALVERLVVPDSAAGERLDRFLAQHVGSRAAATRAVEAGVLVEGEPRPKSYRLEGGETLELAAPRIPPPRDPPTEPPRVAYRDEHLL